MVERVVKGQTNPKSYFMVITVIILILSMIESQHSDHASNQTNNHTNSSNDANNNKKRPLTPEEEDELNDKNLPPTLTPREQQELNKQWHPPGHSSPKSTAYAGYRGPNRAVLKPEEATLSLEIFPLYYTPITRSSSFRLNFSSNVMRKRDINFEVYYSMSRYINFNFHPTKVQLKLWDNVYWIKFGKPVMVDEFDVMRSFEYTEATFKNLFKEMPVINTKQQNMIFLDPQRRYSFKAFNVRKIAETRGRVLCKHKIRRIRGYKLLKKLMEERKKRKQKELDEQDKIAREAESNAKRNMNQRSRKLTQVKKNVKQTTEKEKTTLEEVKDGRRSMLLLYGRKFIKEIIIVCEIK